MMPFMSFQINIVFHLMCTFHHLNEITTFVRRHKERNKQSESVKFKIRFFSKFLALKFCSTSPPGGNQVDGLPPVPHTATVAIHNRLGPRKSLIFAHPFDCVVAVMSIIRKFLVETHPLAY